MNTAFKVFVSATALIAGLCVNSYASPGIADTKVSTRGSADAAWGGPSGFLLAQQTEDSITVRFSDPSNLKDPNMALLYAVIPGVVVHGSGHFYAGKTGTGAALLGAGVVGGYIFYIGAVGKSISGESGELGKFENVFWAFGGVLFFGSWIYDLVGAPHAVQRENRELLGGEDVRLKFGFDQTSHSVQVQIAKRF